MGSDEYFLNEEEQSEIIDKCEKMLRMQKQYYFDVHEFENLIDYYIDAHNLSKADEVTNIARKQHPACIEIEFRKAKLLVEQQQYNNALNILHQISELDKSNADIHILKGVCFVNLDSYKKAVELFNEALSYSQEIEEDNIYNIALTFLSKHQYNIALNYLLRALNIVADHSMLLYDIAYCYEKIGKDEKALRFYNQFIDTEPYSDNAWYNVGIIYNKLNKFNDAITAFEYVIAINPDFSSAYFNKANCLANWEKYDDAISAYNEFLELDPDNVIALYYLGECYEKKDEQKTAFSYFKKCVELEEYFADGWYGLAVVSYNLKYYLEGITYIKKALELDADNGEFWYFHGELCFEVSDFKADCLESYKRATELIPEENLYWLAYAEGARELKSTSSAIKILQKGLTFINNDAEILFTLAAYFYRESEKKIAQDYFTLGLTSDKELLDAFFENCSLEDSEKVDFINIIKQHQKL